uniref:DDE Tnp4 domain-containing protein n=1 Tax=Amphimedon queenslandica TaxID=400682 RepID=A0A1X7TNE6_AMPQE
MSSSRFDNLLRRVKPFIVRKTTQLREPVSAEERLSVTLRYLVTGDSMQTISFSYRLGHSTVSYIIEETCQALWRALSVEFLQPPKSSDEWKKISEGFADIWNFPHCIGAMDGKHILMQAPPNVASQYFNYKGTHSIVLMAVCYYNYCFLLLDIGDYGKKIDDVISGQSAKLPYFFIGDSAFPLMNSMLKPYPGTYLPENKHISNYRLLRARRVIENAFGILASKFCIFRRPVVAKAHKVTLITQAACALQNFLTISEMHCPTSGRFYCPVGYIDREDPQGNVIPGDWMGHCNTLQSVRHVGSNLYSKSAAEVRDSFMNYFNLRPGSVP